MCALSGMLATGLPIPIIANNFNIFYSYSRVREKLQKRLVRAKKSIIKRNSSLNSSKSSRVSKPNDESGTLTDSDLSNAQSSFSVKLASNDDTDAPTANEQNNSSEETITVDGFIQTNCNFRTQNTTNESIVLAQQNRNTIETTGLDDDVFEPLENVSPRMPNGILKRQSSFSINNTETQSAANDILHKKLRRAHSSHSFPLLDSTAKAGKANEHKILRRISSVSFKLDDDVFT